MHSLLLVLCALAQEPEAAAPQDPGCCAQVIADALAPIGEDASAKERALRAIHDGRDALRHYALSPALLEEKRTALEKARAGGDPKALFAAWIWYGSFLMYHGRVDEAVAELEGCAELVEGAPQTYSAADRREVLKRLGLAWFRMGERRNCMARHSSESCIFPLQGAALHVETRGAERAAEVMQRLLELDPDDHEARWLLNLAHQALGTPEAVPGELRFPRARLASEAPFRRFVDAARELALAPLGRAGSVLAEDLTGDGRLDLLTCSFDTGAPLALYAGLESGGFEEIGERAGLARQLGGSNLVQGDVDGDGRLDVLVLRGSEFATLGEWPCSLLRQKENGVFEDVTAAAGIELAAPSESAAFADVDADGDLDLFVAYQTQRDVNGPIHPSRMYRNDGAGRFEDVTAESGLRNDAYCMAAVFGDFDGDGLPDLFLTNQFSPNRLYRNLGACKFEDATEAAGVAAPLTASRAAFAFDPDQDGDLDLFVGRHEHVSEREIARWLWDGTVQQDTMRLYRNDGRGRFADATTECGLRRVNAAMGALGGDVDGDGWPDVFVSTGSEDLAALWPKLLYRNSAGKRFLDVTEAAGVGHLQKGSGAALADLDDDGDRDLYLVLGGRHLDDGFGDALFENPGFGARWLRLELAGERSNRFGLGARVRVRVRDAEGERDVYDHVWPASSLGGSPLRREIGLGQAQSIAELEVRWPGPEGKLQVFRDVPLDAHLRARESASELERLHRPARSWAE
jgi:hypothetical protein